ncbi:MAG: hypothetical protein WDA11_06000 [Thiohalomonadaceae bacterium]
MSHTQFVYPQTAPAVCSAQNSIWYVGEDKETYTAGFTDLLDLTDRIIDKLLKAEAVCWVLHDAKDYPENALAETTAVIAELIHEAYEAHTTQWEGVKRLAKRKR